MGWYLAWITSETGGMASRAEIAAAGRFQPRKSLVDGAQSA
jgi:hypothetical protein